MQVVILCGGQGTRIRDVAEDIPKPMIPVGGRPILWHIMKTYAHYGFNDFILCLGYKSWTIKRYFLDYCLARADFSLHLSRPDELQLHESNLADNWHVTLAETGDEAMTGCRVKRIEKYIRGDHFCLTYGDGLADVDILQLVEFHRTQDRIGTVTAVAPPGRFGELTLERANVAEFSEKPARSQGWISGGFFVFRRDLFDRLDDDPQLVFEQHPLRGLAADGELAAFRHHGFWQPMDNSRDHRYLNELWDSGRAPWRVWDRSRLRIAV